MAITTIFWPLLRRPLTILFFLFIFTHLLGRPDQLCSGIRLSDKRYQLDWEALVNEQEAETIRRLLKLYAHSSDDRQEFDDFDTLERPTRGPEKTKVSDQDTEAAVNRLSKLDKSHPSPVPWVSDRPTGRAERLHSEDLIESADRNKRRNDTLFFIIVGTCSIIGILGLVAAAIFWYKIQKRAEATIESDYLSYGYSGAQAGASKGSAGSAMSDRKLARSTQMYHYEQQRQRMIAQERAHLEGRSTHSDESDDDTSPGNDYTVYECPGLAPTGEMEVRNPLFAEPDSSLTSTTTTTNSHYPQLSNPPSSSSPPKEKFLS